MLPFRARVDLGAMAMKSYSAFLKAPALLELHHQNIHDTFFRGVLPLGREAVSVFYSPSWQGKNCWGNLTSLQRCSLYILQPQLTGQKLLGESYLFAEMQSVYSTAPADWAKIHTYDSVTFPKIQVNRSIEVNNFNIQFIIPFFFGKYSFNLKTFWIQLMV